MTVLPAAGYLEDTARDIPQMKQGFEDVVAAIKELMGGAAETELTINSGSVTPTGAIHNIDTESDAGTDDLANIAITNHPEGRVIGIRPNNASRAVVVKHAAGGDGQVYLNAAAELTMSSTSIMLFLQRRGTAWYEVWRTASPVVGADIASAAALPVNVPGQIHNVTGTTAITSMASVGAGDRIKVLRFTGILTITHHATDLICITGGDIITAADDIGTFYEYATGDWRMIDYVREDGTPLVANAASPDKRQTILAGAVNATTGLAEFLQIGTGLAVNLLATSVPAVFTAANGWDASGGPVDYIKKYTSDQSSYWSGLADDTTNYLFAVYAAGSWSGSASTLPHKEQRGGTIDTTNGQYTWDIAAHKMYLGNGTTAPEVIAVPAGQCVTASGSVTSVTPYALRGEFAVTVFSLAVDTLYIKPHNIGSYEVDVECYLRYTSAQKWMRAEFAMQSTGTRNGATTGQYDTLQAYVRTSSQYILFNEWAEASGGTSRTTGEALIKCKRSW